ncbi:SDR family NAD(P)-dependent oxidoreductase [Nocardia sp. FBN12]|uniref:SDR family NAD(P)-dependent oxidoreductase n=1 Tax=Nocardia sp. FBN12 TaxID=3419766 RepID=UPI003D0470B3
MNREACALRLTGKTVVVTGASKGIGAEIADRIEEAGAHVIAVARRDSATRSVHRLDVTAADQWATLAAELEAAGGAVHGLVNCAGITRRSRIDAVSAEDMTDAYAVNVLGPLFAIQALTPLMHAGGSIVNIGSIAALTGHYPVAYTTSKWAVRGLTHAAALSLGERGIRVNAVHPGFIDTPMTASAPAVFRDASIGETALGRAGTPAEVAGVVEFLLSDDSTYVTGSEIVVDGGVVSHGGVKSISDALRAATVSPVE